MIWKCKYCGSTKLHIEYWDSIECCLCESCGATGYSLSDIAEWVEEEEEEDDI